MWWQPSRVAIDNPAVRGALSRQGRRVEIGLAQGALMLIALALFPATPAGQKTGPVTSNLEFLLGAAASLLFTASVFVLAMSVAGALRWFRIRRLLARGGWRPFEGTMRFPGWQRSLATRCYLDDGVALMKVKVTYWREGPLTRVMAGEEPLWRCGDTGKPSVVWVPGTNQLYLARIPLFPEMASLLNRHAPEVELPRVEGQRPPGPPVSGRWPPPVG
ncbi:hypothetical protein [Nocardioides sp.]|uniref:hypothetical protein n=1 Tax=Nocardioides sp. TaxID=35761 RepID=UPI003527A6B9